MKHTYKIEKRNQRIDEFLKEEGLSSKYIKDIKMNGDIQVNGVHKTVRYHLQVGDLLELFPPKEESTVTPVYIPLDIVYEDEWLLVLNKQKDLPCIPTRSHPTYTLANGLKYYFESQQMDCAIHLVNRLDKETAGLMVIAKDRYIHDMFNKTISHMYRVYQAHVFGSVNEGEIDLPIYKVDKQMKRIIDEKGQSSQTLYKCLETKDNISLVQFVLKTGRTHQIRVHMSAIGHPLIGDSLYGDVQGDFDLTSVEVEFVHPITKELMNFKRHI